MKWMKVKEGKEAFELSRLFNPTLGQAGQACLSDANYATRLREAGLSLWRERQRVAAGKSSLAF
jgi:hypothetical protein